MLPIREGMKVLTNTPAVRESRKAILQLILSEHPADCQTCYKNQECELQRIASDFGLRELKFNRNSVKKEKHPESKYINRDLDYCILCGRCVSVCGEIQTVNSIDYSFRGYDSKVNTPYNVDLAETKCVSCGQCVLSCPTAALSEHNDITNIYNELAAEKFTIAQFAPATRAAIGEEFGFKPGEITTGKIVSALRKLGFKKVFDTNFGADLTILEEGTEFIHRIKNGNLPLFTSCCPSWINFAELFYPQLLSKISTCKSPHEMLGALAKYYYGKKNGIDLNQISVTSIMPCTAKKQECNRTELRVDGINDVDYVITTRELVKMIKESGIDFESLPNDYPDDPLGSSTGAAAIFANSGGVMEAALRTVSELLDKKEIRSLEYKEVRGLTGVRESSINIAGTQYNVAVTSGLGNARKLIESILNETKKYDFVEIMACPGGCIGGGGQPVNNEKSNRLQILKERSQGIYNLDKTLPKRKSHENESVIKIYKEFLGEPYSKKSHELLHTTYKPRKHCGY
ncbi:4Fe-4S dicluster domain-containing protein [Candidatus Bathyarchaeota archaeon]|nr:4Fe-4S dicluster domain-containing protein [Candidatus Bathyarchaeota archaeon]